MFASLMNDRIDVIDSDGQDGQWGEDIEAQQGVLTEHEEKAESDRHQQVGQVHHGRPGVHTDTADVFRHAAHEVARAVRFIKVRIQLLVVGIDLFLLIVLDMPAHDDNCLSHEKEEKTADQGQHEQGDAACGDLIPEGRVPGVEKADDFPDQDVIVDSVAGIGDISRRHGRTWFDCGWRAADGSGPGRADRMLWFACGGRPDACSLVCATCGGCLLRGDVIP